MKIIALNGSHRGDRGFTQFLLDKLAAGAIEAGAQFETVVLTKFKINRCLGCQECKTEKSYLRCVYEDKDDVTKIFAKMKEADIIIYATPVYVFGMSGLMKTFLDRINATGDSSQLRISQSGLFFHHISHEIYSKPMVVLVTCDNLENETPSNIASYFKTFSQFMDAPLVGTLVRKSGKMMGQGKSPDKEARFPKISDIYEAFRLAGNELAAQGRITRSTEKRAAQNMMGIPCLDILMKLKPFKAKMIEKAQDMMRQE